MLALVVMYRTIPTSLVGLALAASAFGMSLSDIKPDMNRTYADENFTKDYAYRVLRDLSVRRVWNLDENRKLSIDFDTGKDKLLCVIVDYRKPVSTKVSTKDALEIVKLEKAAWRKFSDDKAAKYGMARCLAMKCASGYVFQEMTGSNKVSRVSYYPVPPKEEESRLKLTDANTTDSGVTAMGSDGDSAVARNILKDEETRLLTPNKTDDDDTGSSGVSLATVASAKETPEPKAEDDIAAKASEPLPEELAAQEAASKKTASRRKAPKAERRRSQLDDLLAKLGLENATPKDYAIYGGGLVILFIVIGMIRRAAERKRLAAKAAMLRKTQSGGLKNRVAAGKKRK